MHFLAGSRKRHFTQDKQRIVEREPFPPTPAIAMGLQRLDAICKDPFTILKASDRQVPPKRDTASRTTVRSLVVHKIRSHKVHESGGGSLHRQRNISRCRIEKYQGSAGLLAKDMRQSHARRYFFTGKKSCSVPEVLCGRSKHVGVRAYTALARGNPFGGTSPR